MAYNVIMLPAAEDDGGNIAVFEYSLGNIKRTDALGSVYLMRGNGDEVGIGKAPERKFAESLHRIEMHACLGGKLTRELYYIPYIVEGTRFVVYDHSRNENDTAVKLASVFFHIPYAARRGNCHYPETELREVSAAFENRGMLGFSEDYFAAGKALFGHSRADDGKIVCFCAARGEDKLSFGLFHIGELLTDERRRYICPRFVYRLFRFKSHEMKR